MQNEWVFEEVDSNNKRIFPELEKTTEQILIKKGLENNNDLESFLVPDYEKDLHDPFLLNDMKIAVDRVLKAKKNNEKVCVYGDYDADGVTSSILLVDFLEKELGIDAFCYIPDREKEGYSLNKKSLNLIKEKGTTLIITVDCGITNFEEIEFAKNKNMDVIILDHHNVLTAVPDALAIIDPKNPKEKKYPFKELAGVGVAFKFLQGLSLSVVNFNKDKLKWYLDLVAVGTVADCVPLLGENRVLVKFGLMVLAKTKRTGFRQLFQNGRIRIGEGDLPSSQQIAFQIAPRINAAGRMSHAKLAYELLKESGELKASELAQEIELQNKNRQKVTNDILKKVKKEVRETEDIPRVIIKVSSEWKMGIIGLSAGRLVEEFSRPVILLQCKNGICRGSGRSIPGFNLVEALTRQSKLLEKYGGHDQAAGLTLRKENFKNFKKAFIVSSSNDIPKEVSKKINIDAELKMSEINKKLYGEISMLEPFGYGNNLPCFLTRGVRVSKKKNIGKDEKHLKLWLNKDNYKKETIEAIGFNVTKEASDIKDGDLIDVVFNLEENNWNRSNQLQLKILDYIKVV